MPRDGAQTFVIYDDRHPEDRQHVELICRHIDIVPVPLPNSGHPAGAALATLGLLSTAFTEMIDGMFDPQALAALLPAPPPTDAQTAAPSVPDRPSYVSQLLRWVTGRA